MAIDTVTLKTLTRASVKLETNDDVQDDIYLCLVPAGTFPPAAVMFIDHKVSNMEIDKVRLFQLLILSNTKCLYL